MIRLAFIFIVLIAFVACKDRKLAKTVVIKDYYIKNELLIQLKSGDSVAELESKFKRQGLKVTDEVAPWLGIVKASFDTTKIKPELMFARLKLNELVKDVEFNKRTSSRGN